MFMHMHNITHPQSLKYLPTPLLKCVYFANTYSNPSIPDTIGIESAFFVKGT